MVFHKKCKNLKPVMDVVDVFNYQKEDKLDDEVYENSIMNVEESINTMKEYKNELMYTLTVKEGDVIEVLDCYRWKGTNLLKSQIHDNILKCKSSKLMNDILKNRKKYI